jgi:predicted amidohydrolase
MQKPFAIAGIQMKVYASHSNLDMMKFKLDVLMSTYPWVQMVMFSELCTFGPMTNHAVELPGPLEDEFAAMARKHQIWLLPGSVFEKRGDKIMNTAMVFNPEGALVGRYRKMFPFLPYEEGVTGGDEFFMFDVPEVGRFGVSICYDMWFPETTRTLAAMGCEVILHPTLTGTIDREIELSIVQASAAINQCFIFDFNGLYAGGNGHSIVCGPDGRVLYKASTGEESVPIEIDMSRVDRSRKFGVLRLGQPLKSFRDRNVDFAIYDKNKHIPYLESLGPLRKQSRLDKIGEALETPEPYTPERSFNPVPSAGADYSNPNLPNLNQA